MTQADYLAFVEKAMNRYLDNKKALKRGQVYMNVLQEVFPTIHKEVIGTYADCSYKDVNIDSMLAILIDKID